ncbi:MAG: inositol monophosphatase family protein [Chitinivibrionales bacterium]
MTIIDIARKAALVGGEILLEHAGKITGISTKQNNSLVTDIDKRCEDEITRIIRSAFPGHGIVAEESGISGGDGEYRWIIDPLDGTHNYIRGLKLYGNCIAVMKGSEFIAGVVYLPQEKLLFSAEKGSGCYRNDEKVSVSKRGELSRCTLSYDSGISSEPEKKAGLLQKLAPEFFNIRMFGASSILLARLAEGVIDVAIEFDDELWDYAAGVTLVQEAGGIFTSQTGERITDTTRGYVASNGTVHETVLELLRGYA